MNCSQMYLRWIKLRGTVVIVSRGSAEMLMKRKWTSPPFINKKKAEPNE
jgi:hypothetical protein